MKNFKFLCVAMLTLLLASACNEKEEEQMTNQLSLSIEGQSEMAENDKEVINVKAALSLTPKKDVTVELNLTGNDGDVVKLSESKLVFKAGEKVKNITVTSNDKHLVKGQRAMTLSVLSTSDANVKALEPVSFVIKQDSDIPQLTAKQQQLIKGYKDKFGIDLMRFIGKLKVRAEVVYCNDDKAEWFGGKDKDVFEGYTIITLSDKATANKPILKMTENAMGLNSFFYNLLLRKTLEDKVYFCDQPYGQAVSKVLKFDRKKEYFKTALDDIVLKPTKGTISYLAMAKDLYDTPIKTVPFIFEFSAWNKLQEIAKKGNVTVEVKTSADEKPFNVTITDDVLIAGGSIDPNRWFCRSTLIKDDYGKDPSNWFMPTAKFDLKKGTMSFDFPYDFDEASDYMQFHVTYFL